tara:strand:- start:803 stop:931 length:129 start_codon:yes stop_codon:yes gene_type:complete
LTVDVDEAGGNDLFAFGTGENKVGGFEESAKFDAVGFEGKFH